MKTIATALTLVLISTAAFATNTQPTTRVEQQTNVDVQQNTDVVASPTANAEGGKNKNDTTIYAAPSMGAPALPSGSNLELAPEGWSGGISVLFGGLSFGRSTQLPTPNAGYTLMDIAEIAWGSDGSLGTFARSKGIRATAFLCEYYGGFARRNNIVCD